jgi:beta-lactam-binding protein with PASTA domain
MSYTDAEAAINAAGLVMGDLNFIFSETVVEWDIISQIPAAGTAAYPSTFVDLVVSRGPDVVIVPDVVGMTEMDAESEIYGAWPYTGTTINFHYSYSDTIAEGYLISQNPAAGSSVPHESSVDIEVSLGPLATVPGVVGMTQADAEVAITAAGLTVGMTQVDAEAAIVAAGLVVGPADAYYSDSVAEGYVINQYPAAGTKVSYDPEVILDISLGPEPE